MGETADPWWDGAVAGDLGGDLGVLEVPGADHALEVDGSPADLDGIVGLFLRSLPAVRP